MNTLRHLCLLCAVSLWLVGCSSQSVLPPTASSAKVPLRGYNLLQDSKIPFASDATSTSLQKARATGANTIAIATFLSQPAADNPLIETSPAVSADNLRAAIRQARQLGMQTMVKPIVLVPDSWAGAIAFHNAADQALWFARYQNLLEFLARLAEEEHVDALVIGNELAGLYQAPYWPGLIGKLREHYHGKLTFAANGAQGIREFPYWQQLDAVSVSLYPALGSSGSNAEMHANIQASLNTLRQHTLPINRPVWILEVGQPSARGFLERPWDWRGAEANPAGNDTASQAQVLSLWLQDVGAKSDWIEALLIWSWFNAPEAGGPDDPGYTPQNKPAELAVRCQWIQQC